MADSVRAVIDRKQRFVAALFAFMELLDKKSRSGKEKKKMKNNKAKAAFVAALAAAAGSGICCALKHGRKKKMPDMAADEAALHEEGLTEEKLREYLLRLFRLYEDSEFDDIAEFLGVGSEPREYAADNYSSQLFPYIKKNMKDVMIMEGDDGTGKEPFSMTDVLFDYPVCMIGCEIRELFSDNFALCLESEIWMLENGEFASVYCVGIGNGRERLTYRFLDTYIKNPEDISVCFDDLETGFTQIIEAVEEGREPEFP